MQTQKLDKSWNYISPKFARRSSYDKYQIKLSRRTHDFTNVKLSMGFHEPETREHRPASNRVGKHNLGRKMLNIHRRKTRLCYSHSSEQTLCCFLLLHSKYRGKLTKLIIMQHMLLLVEIIEQVINLPCPYRT